MTFVVPRGMEILVGLSGDLCKYFAGERRIEVPALSTVGDLVDSLGLMKGEVGVIALNGSLATRSEQLHEGDEVLLFPPIGGG
jgi:sulfur carrier protein ThiS